MTRNAASYVARGPLNSNRMVLPGQVPNYPALYQQPISERGDGVYEEGCEPSKVKNG